MNVDFERRLRSEMARAAIDPRPGVVREAYRRSLRRTHATRVVTIAGVASLTAAAAGIAITGGTAGPGRPASPVAPPAPVTTTKLIGHVTSALDATRGDIGYVRDVSFQPNNYHGTYTSWTYGMRNRGQQLDDSGKPEMDFSTSRTYLPGNHRKMVITSIDYHARTATESTWDVRPSPLPTISRPPICSKFGGLFDLGHGPVTPIAIPAALTCGVVTVTEHQRLGGTEAIKITPRNPGGDLAPALWVNESTYLPIKLTWRFTSGAYKGGGDDFYFAWLPPTKANLAQLNAPIPPGFKVTVRAIPSLPAGTPKVTPSS